MVKEVKLNERQVAVINALKGSNKALTLAEISGIVGFEVKSGTTNTLVKRGAIKVVGERTIVCMACGHKHTVKEYTIGDQFPECKLAVSQYKYAMSPIGLFFHVHKIGGLDQSVH